MKVTFHEQDDVLIRRFSGEVCFDAIMESWENLISSYSNLEKYKGILTTYLDADMKEEASNLNIMVEFFQSHMDQLKNLRIAVVMNTPMVTNTIIVSQKVRSLQIKPFSTVEAAISWILNE